MNSSNVGSKSTLDIPPTTTTLEPTIIQTDATGFPFDPGDVDIKISALLTSLCKADGEVIIDSGAGRGIKPTMFGLTDPKSSTTRIIWGDGTSANATTEASVPGHHLPPFLVTPKASGTLVSVGANMEGKQFCYCFFDRHVFQIDGLQVFKDRQGRLKARSYR